jgi:hypothetical protein
MKPAGGMTMRIALTLCAAGLALAGCGKKQMLQPADARPLPVQPATAPARPQPADLLATDTQQRPTRFNELVTQSQELQADRFDMPPPG